MNYTLFLPFMKKKNSMQAKSYSRVESFFSLHKPCQIMSSLEASILTLTKSKYPFDETVLLF